MCFIGSLGLGYIRLRLNNLPFSSTHSQKEGEEGKGTCIPIEFWRSLTQLLRTVTDEVKVPQSPLGNRRGTAWQRERGSEGERKKGNGDK